jgi:hypothetical protein
LDSLFQLANLIEAADKLQEVPSREGREYEEADAVNDILSRSDCHITRLSYRSPFEIVMTVSGSITVVGVTIYLTGVRAVDLFQRIQSARRSKAETDLYVRVYEEVEDMVRTNLTSFQRLILLQHDSKLKEAVQCLGELDTLEGKEPGDSL